MSVETIMYEEARKEYEEAGKLELGSDQHVKTIQAANSIVDRLSENMKIENEARKLDLEERRLEIEEQRLENDKKGNLVRNVLTGAMFVLSTGVTIWANIDAKKFEGAFTHTTEAGRNSTRKLLSLLDKIKM